MCGKGVAASHETYPQLRARKRQRCTENGECSHRAAPAPLSMTSLGLCGECRISALLTNPHCVASPIPSLQQSQLSSGTPALLLLIWGLKCVPQTTESQEPCEAWKRLFQWGQNENRDVRFQGLQGLPYPQSPVIAKCLGPEHIGYAQPPCEASLKTHEETEVPRISVTLPKVTSHSGQNLDSWSGLLIPSPVLSVGPPGPPWEVFSGLWHRFPHSQSEIEVTLQSHFCHRWLLPASLWHVV